MKSSAPVCPVPAEQQPINEYQELRESWFFRWATLDLKSYLKPLVILWLLSWAIAGPVATVSFPMAKLPMHFFLSGAAGATLVPFLALLRLWLGWVYVCNRLLQVEIFYEESGWYDGQTWVKPEEVVQRDRLIVTYQIQPLLKRLKQTFVVYGAIVALGTLLWQIV